MPTPPSRRRILSSLFVLALVTFLSLATLRTVDGALSTSMTVEVSGSQILVDGRPFFIKGVVYSPSPIGYHPAWTWPNGDFFIPQYQNLWARDFPLLKALGANTLRIYGWNNELDHGYFLDQAHAHGLKVIVTFQMSNAWSNPVHEEWQRQQHYGRFVWQVRKYLGHPALLAWSFGEQMNLLGTGYLQAFNDAFQCSWNSNDYSYGGGCFNNPDTHHACAGTIACVYEHFFGFLNQAAGMAKNVIGDTKAHLIIASISDVDLSWKRTQQFSYAADNIDAWGLQIYRGKDFGQGSEDYLTNYEKATPHNARGESIGAVKPLIVVEYGVDAYRDPCGTNDKSPCYNDYAEGAPSHGDSGGEDESAQAEWGASLASIISQHSSASTPPRGAVAGGTINSWVDEAWRCTSGVGGCGGPIPYPLPGFDATQCSWKAHVQCPQMNLWHKSLCGYYTPATFDKYANVGWFGMMAPSPQWGDVDKLRPRLLYGKLQEQWSHIDKQWAWIVVLLLSAAIAGACTYYTYTEYARRRAQVHELERRTSEMASVKGRSPLGSGLPSHPSPTQRRGSRHGHGPAGRSSRAPAQMDAASTNSPRSGLQVATESSPLMSTH